MSPIKIQTERLELVAATIEMVEAELHDRTKLGQLLDAVVPWYWPPPLVDENSMKISHRYLQENSDAAGWITWYFILREGKEGQRTAIGEGSFKGKPSPDGTVEIGYSLLEEYRQRGYGTEVVKGFVTWAFHHENVTRIIAETLQGLTPSIRVLEKNGFVHIGRGSEEGIIRLELKRSPFKPSPSET